MSRSAHSCRHSVRPLGGLALGLVLLAACATPSCNSNGNTTARDAACDLIMPHTCPAIGCSQSLAAGCAQRPGLCDVTEWPADPTAFCHLNPQVPSDYVGVGDSCGSYHLLVANDVDGGVDFYYSASTGKLVAIVSHDYEFGRTTCLGGPSNFVEPKCDFATVDCTDAGGGTGGAGGGGGAGPRDSGSGAGGGG